MYFLAANARHGT